MDDTSFNLKTDEKSTKWKKMVHSYIDYYNAFWRTEHLVWALSKHFYHYLQMKRVSVKFFDSLLICKFFAKKKNPVVHIQITLWIYHMTSGSSQNKNNAKRRMF